MNALKPRPPFQVLIMCEESRLGREEIETAYALKQIMDAGVRVFFYLEDRERTLDTAMDKVMLSLANFAAEMEREKARQRTYDAMVRKAKALHVTGGRVYGFDNVEVPSPEGNGPRLRVVARSTRSRQRSSAASSALRLRYRGGSRSPRLNAGRRAAARGGADGRRPLSARCCTGSSTAVSSSGTGARRSSGRH